MSLVILDLETRPDPMLVDLFLEGITAPKNLKDPEKIAAAIQEKKDEARKEMSLDPDLCEIVCIGVKPIDEEAIVMGLEEFIVWLGEPFKETGWKGRQTESSLNASRKFIGFNSRCFDLPVLIKTCIRKNLDLPFSVFLGALDKYKGNNHIDLMEKISMVYGKSKSLDKYLQIYLGIKKTPIDFDTASEDEIRAHCKEDIENTEKLYKKFECLFV